jgi:hypothetical protein
MPGARQGLAIGMTTVGFIGSGRIGGYDVVLSNSRGPQTLKDLVEELGAHAWAATPAGAAAAGDLVASIPPRGLPGSTREAAGREAGPGHDQLHSAARWADARARWLALSSSEALQRHLGPAPAVKSVQQHHLLAPRLAGPCGGRDRP